MKKKVISMLLVSAMAMTLIAGCGNNGADEKKSEGDGKTLEVWVAPLDDDTVNNWKPLLKDWEKENDCTVNVKVVPWDSYEAVSYTHLVQMPPGRISWHSRIISIFISAGLRQSMIFHSRTIPGLAIWKAAMPCF